MYCNVTKRSPPRDRPRGWVRGSIGQLRLQGDVEEEVGVRGRRVRGERPDHSRLHREHQRGFCQHANGHGFVESDIQVRFLGFSILNCSAIKPELKTILGSHLNTYYLTGF